MDLGTMSRLKYNTLFLKQISFFFVPLYNIYGYVKENKNKQTSS